MCNCRFPLVYPFYLLATRLPLTTAHTHTTFLPSTPPSTAPSLRARTCYSNICVSQQIRQRNEPRNHEASRLFFAFPSPLFSSSSFTFASWRLARRLCSSRRHHRRHAAPAKPLLVLRSDDSVAAAAGLPLLPVVVTRPPPSPPALFRVEAAMKATRRQRRATATPPNLLLALRSEDAPAAMPVATSPQPASAVGFGTTPT